jgi:hypothetical protein
MPAAPSIFPFERLPIEIQHKIWRCAVDDVGPRVVEFRLGIQRKPAEWKYLYTCTYTSSCPIPGVLQACSYSRELAL